MKTYYQLLDVPATASQDEIKRAFRLQIARYHPDKVHHLGKEFQEMAAERAAELTEAYRILSDETRRATYDASLADGHPTAPAAPPPSSRPAEAAPFQPSASSASTTRGEPDQSEAPPTGRVRQERAGRDELMRKVTIGRLRQAFEALAGDYDESAVRGFDVACVPKSKLFGRKGPRLCGRFVSCVDSAAVAEAWTNAGKSSSGSDETCIFLIGSSLAPSRELAAAIAEQRRKTRTKVTLIPIDARDWDAHVPTDAPPVAKTLLARLRSGT